MWLRMIKSMTFSIRMTEEEKKLAESYAKLNSCSVGEAIKKAFFEKIEDEYDIALAENILKNMAETGEEPQPISELWKNLEL
jgi:predicted DNA-binding protein